MYILNDTLKRYSEIKIIYRFVSWSRERILLCNKTRRYETRVFKARVKFLKITVLSPSICTWCIHAYGTCLRLCTSPEALSQFFSHRTARFYTYKYKRDEYYLWVCADLIVTVCTEASFGEPESGTRYISLRLHDPPRCSTTTSRFAICAPPPFLNLDLDI